MSQILGSSSYIKIESALFDYNSAYTMLLNYRVDTTPSGNYYGVIAVSNGAAAAYQDTDAVQINPFPTPKVHRLNIKKAGSGSTPGGAVGVASPDWFNPSVIRSAQNSIRLWLASATETATATTATSSRTAATNLAIGAVLGTSAADFAVITIHSCKIWTKALDSTGLAAEIVQVEPVDAVSLWGWWFFDNSADKWNDRSGNGHHFTLVGTSTHTSDKPSGVTEPSSATTYECTTTLATSVAAGISGKLSISPTVTLAAGVAAMDGGQLAGNNQIVLQTVQSVISGSTLAAIRNIAMSIAAALASSGGLGISQSVALPVTLGAASSSAMGINGTASIGISAGANGSSQAGFATTLNLPVTAGMSANSLLAALSALTVGFLTGIDSGSGLTATASTTVSVTVAIDTGTAEPITATVSIGVGAGAVAGGQLSAAGNASVALNTGLVSNSQLAATNRTAVVVNVAAGSAGQLNGVNQVSIATGLGLADSSTLNAVNSALLAVVAAIAEAGQLTAGAQVGLQVSGDAQVASTLAAVGSVTIGYAVTVTSGTTTPINVTVSLPVTSGASAQGIVQMVSNATLAAAAGMAINAPVIFAVRVPVGVSITVDTGAGNTQSVNVSMTIHPGINAESVWDAQASVGIAHAVATLATGQLGVVSNVELSTVHAVVASGVLSALHSLALQVSTGMLTAGSVISFTVTTPDGRTATVTFDSRIIDVGSMIRVVSVKSEDRTIQAK